MMKRFSSIVLIALLSAPCLSVSNVDIADAAFLTRWTASNPSPCTTKVNDVTLSEYEVIRSIEYKNVDALQVEQTYPEERARCIIAVRGTDDKLSDWINNVDIRYEDAFGGYLIHQGFKRHAWLIIEADEDAMRDWFKSCHDRGMPLAFTGGSLGGAAATVLAIAYESGSWGLGGGGSRHVQSLVTFGAPRVTEQRSGGKQQCPEHLQNSENAVRMVTVDGGKADKVPFLPTAWMMSLGTGKWAPTQPHCMVAMQVGDDNGTLRDTWFPNKHSKKLSQDESLHGMNNYEREGERLYEASIPKAYGEWPTRMGSCAGFTGYEEQCEDRRFSDVYLNLEHDQLWRAGIYEFSSSTAGYQLDDQCMFFVKTDSGTCQDYCRSQDSQCLKAMDNLGDSKCTPNVSGRNSKRNDNGGCYQEWNNQICVCSRKRPYEYTLAGKSGVERVRVDGSEDLRLSKEEEADFATTKNWFYIEYMNDTYGRGVIFRSAERFTRVFHEHMEREDWACGSPNENWRCDYVREGLWNWGGSYKVTFSGDNGPDQEFYREVPRLLE